MTKEELKDEIKDSLINYKSYDIGTEETATDIMTLFAIYQKSIDDKTEPLKAAWRSPKKPMSKEQITKAEELISDTIRKVDKLFGLL